MINPYETAVSCDTCPDAYELTNVATGKHAGYYCMAQGERMERLFDTTLNNLQCHPLMEEVE